MKSWMNARILMTTDAVGGVWVFATALARALARDGYRVHLVVLGPPPSGEQLAVWGRFGRGPGEFIRPYGVAVDRQGNVYVSDMATRCAVLISRSAYRPAGNGPMT